MFIIYLNVISIVIHKKILVLYDMYMCLVCDVLFVVIKHRQKTSSICTATLQASYQ